ncbi:MAG: mRNA cap guanine-N7 methyltransferase [Stictis urceolatum]|nr:mRNA cap guanine-N7 methyltransferase [Stictis urceolata]
MYDPIRDLAAGSAKQGNPPPRRRSPASQKRHRSPSPLAPSRSRSRSPPRQRKRPGAASRVDAAAREALLLRQQEREAEQLAASQKAALERGSHDVVKQHYNAVPQRGREWRKTDSKIKGLRSFNNWVKSVLIQKFSPNEDFTPNAGGRGFGGGRGGPGIMVLDIGCGKGGDLGKWQKAPQRVDCFVGVDPAEVSIDQAKERYEESSKRSRGRLFEGHFFAKDGFGEWLGDIPIIRSVGIDSEVGPGSSSRWGNAGFDVVTMMFCMHYAFESEEKARGMLKNVAGALKKGGRFIGVIPNSDIIREKVEAYHTKKKTNGEAEANWAADNAEDGEVKDDTLHWGNDIYNVRFPGDTPQDGVFRPPFGWKYSYFIEEAVEAPEYLVPFEAFRALAEDYNLEMQYRKPFHDVWKEERADPTLGELSERMGVTSRRGGNHNLSPEEWEAVGFYHAFCFYKV